MNRKEFLGSIGKACGCSCVVALAADLGLAKAQGTQDKEGNAPRAVQRTRSEERLDFAEKWAVRFFDVLDANLDVPARKRIMMANGRACLLSHQKAAGQKTRAEAMTMESFARQVKEKGSSDYRIEGNTIFFQYPSAAGSGSASSASPCLCPLVETRPAGLSPTYCLCSLGYVKEMHEQIFKKPVDVELLSSVLRGDQKCRFKITVG